MQEVARTTQETNNKEINNKELNVIQLIIISNHRSK